MSRNESLAENARWIWAPNASGPNHYVEFLRELHVERTGNAAVGVSSRPGTAAASEGRHGGRPSREGPAPSGLDCEAGSSSETNDASVFAINTANNAPDDSDGGVAKSGFVIEAWIQLSAETSLQLWINGRLIHCGPPREVAPYFYFDTIDLRPHLRAGRNELRIVAHHQGTDSQSYQAGTPALLVAGKFVTRVDGEGAGESGGVTQIDFAEPAGWRVRRIARYRADAHRLFGCIGFSEHVDFSVKDLPWDRACLVAKAPWNERPTALLRDMPFLRETVRFAVREKGYSRTKERVERSETTDVVLRSGAGARDVTDQSAAALRLHSNEENANTEDANTENANTEDRVERSETTDVVSGSSAAARDVTDQSAVALRLHSNTENANTEDANTEERVERSGTTDVVSGSSAAARDVTDQSAVALRLHSNTEDSNTEARVECSGTTDVVSGSSAGARDVTDQSAVALRLRPNVERLNGGAFLLDMGQEVSGYVELTLRAGRRMSVKTSYGEALSGEGRVDATKGGMNYSDRLELNAGEAVTWRSYEKRAFRFLQLGASAYPHASVNVGASADTNTAADAESDAQPIGLDVIEARVIELCWPYEPCWGKSGEGESAGTDFMSQRSASIQRIREVSARTIELNTEDLLTDCPWRERAQYLDSQFYMGAMQQLFGTLEPIKRFLHQFPRGADKTGFIRACYPSPSSMTVIPDFSMSYAVLLLRYLELSGDLETVRKNLSLAVRGVEVFKQYEDADGLLIDVPGWIFLDNTFELPKFPRSAGLNAVYHGAHRALAELYRRCGSSAGSHVGDVNATHGTDAGQAQIAREFDAKADSLRAAFRKTFLRDGRLLDADSTLEHERYRQWNYHHGPGKGGSFQLRVEFKKADASPPLRLAVNDGARVWIDGVVVASIKEGGSWTRSAIYQPVTLPTPVDTEWHWLELEVEWSGIDWECFVSSLSDVEWRGMTVNGAPTQLRVNPWPWLTQTTVGYAAYHGLLEEDEAKALLKACLPARYTFPFAKRTTPFFAEIADLAEGEKRILPCNVPASLFHFCHALKRYGMETEARELLLPIYAGMLERGATTWWEEWNTGSSLCHAWASFVVEFLEEE